MEFMEGGEMFAHLKRMKRFTETLAQFYAAQVIMGIIYLHSMDLVYRDMKPENLLIDTKGYVRIADFGFAKKVKGKTWTFCGTPDYMAPEVILNQGVDQGVDWWGVGILIFEMCAGFAPFTTEGESKVYTNIVNGMYSIPYHFSTYAEDIIGKFLLANSSTRLGMTHDKISEISRHPWFIKLNWESIYTQKSISDFIPECPSHATIESKKQSIKDLVPHVTTAEEFSELFTDF
ncbi:unnamed protein product [Gordionus sp. m RMFG-2023]